jgi:hypothetical protein
MIPPVSNQQNYKLSGFIARTGLRAGAPGACQSYCIQEHDRCQVSGLPQATCDDRLPVCQNACDVCAYTYV